MKFYSKNAVISSVEIAPRWCLLLLGKTCVKRPLQNRQNKKLNDNWKPNEDREYRRMFLGDHFATLLTGIKQYLILKKSLSFLEWLFYTGFTV